MPPTPSPRDLQILMVRQEHRLLTLLLNLWRLKEDRVLWYANIKALLAKVLIGLLIPGALGVGSIWAIYLAFESNLLMNEQNVELRKQGYLEQASLRKGEILGERSCPADLSFGGMRIPSGTTCYVVEDHLRNLAMRLELETGSEIQGAPETWDKLEWSSLGGVRLNHFKWPQVKFEGVSEGKFDLKNSVFYKVDFSGADLSVFNFENSIFLDCKFAEAKFAKEALKYTLILDSEELEELDRYPVTYRPITSITEFCSDELEKEYCEQFLHAMTIVLRKFPNISARNFFDWKLLIQPIIFEKDEVTGQQPAASIEAGMDHTTQQIFGLHALPYFGGQISPLLVELARRIQSFFEREQQ